MMPAPTMQLTRIWSGGAEGSALDLYDLVCAPGAPWELEIGFGKGRYLLRRAEEDPHRRFLGIEIAGQYYRLARDRAARRGLENLTLVHGEALFLLDAFLPRGWVDVAHVYFPDPWPKARHHKRRLFDPETIDVLLRSLAKPSGRLLFASDHLAYAAKVRRLLAAHPSLQIVERDAWPEGPRTNYEAKYEEEGRTICRLEVDFVAPDPQRQRLGPGPLEEGLELLHPEGAYGITSALSPPRAADEEIEV